VRNAAGKKRTRAQRIRGFTTMRYINLRFTYLLTYSAVAEVGDRGHNRYEPKIWGGGSVPVSRRGGTPSNTMWPGPRSPSAPSGAFIHPAV